MTSTREEQERLAQSPMTRLRVLAGVGQPLPSGNFVPANVPKEIRVYVHEIPQIMEQVRTPQERQWLEEAEEEYTIRLAAHLDQYKKEEDKKKAETTFGESPQSIFFQQHSQSWIRPLLRVEKNYKCPECGIEYYAENGAGCSQCGAVTDQILELPPPKQKERYDANQALMTNLMEEFLPKMTEVQIEAISHIIDRVLDVKLEALTAPKAGSKTGKR
jgi:hypothetical protein